MIATLKLNPVVELIIRDLWELRLARHGLGMDPIQYHDRKVRPASGNFHIERPRRRDDAEYFRMLNREKWKFKDKKDRQIAFALADGDSIHEVKRRHHVGQYRIELILGEMMKGRTKPWHWRKGGKGKTKVVSRARLHRQRRQREKPASTRR